MFWIPDYIILNCHPTKISIRKHSEIFQSLTMISITQIHIDKNTAHRLCQVYSPQSRNFMFTFT